VAQDAGPELNPRTMKKEKKKLFPKVNTFIELPKDE
jgi:hypothetical protein